ncbi:MAG TPA: kelch repeat-containing protein [Gemmata sp.]
MRKALLITGMFFLSTTAIGAEPNTWVKVEGGAIAGRRWDVPLAYSPELKRFLVLGGRTDSGNYNKERPYDVLSIQPEKGAKWRNELPEFGAKWGDEFGPVKAPGWKNETWGFTDAGGNTRPNWAVYGTFSLGTKFGHDPDTGAFYFLAAKSTFKYDPRERTWTNLRRTGPEGELGGPLLWSSMCYDIAAKHFVLFGGGNTPTDRGDPGTWTFAPEARRWDQVMATNEPPQRANAQLVYDPVHARTVLFGGDQLDQLVSDTWVYDSAKRTWTEQKPKVSPAPRAGHAMLWLPKAKKVLLLGGYTYTSTTDYVAPLYKPLPLEAWTYDVAKNEWQLVGTWDKDGPSVPPNGPLPAAVDENDTVMVLDAKNQAWFCTFDTATPGAEATARLSTKPGRVVRRTGSHDPKWYTEGLPAPDNTVTDTRLKALKPNEWSRLPTPRRPGMNMDWGSAVFDSHNDNIIRFSGGHSAYSGTAPFVYDIKSDRYALPFAPEYPIEFVYSNDQVHGEWSFKGNPWMTGHTYKSTGYDPNLKCLVFAAHQYTYFFDPRTGKWSRSAQKNPFAANFYVNTVCSTPDGAVVWADQPGGAGTWLFRLNPETKSWKPLPKEIRTGLHQKSADHHGMCYDSKRARLLLFSDVGEKKGHVAMYDMNTFEVSWLKPDGLTKALAPCRETVYIPDADLVLVGARVRDANDAPGWLAYDCAKNAWVGIPLTGDDPIGKKGPFNNSMGLMYDPKRKVVWAVGQHSEVYALKLDPTKAVPLILIRD